MVGRDSLMTFGSPGTDHNRTTVALVFLVVGILLLVWAWGSWMYRTSVSVPPPVAAEAAGSQERPAPVGEDAMFRPWLIVGAVLVLVVLFGGYVLIRSTRRSSEAGGRRKTPPSSGMDVSAGQRLPERDRGIESDNDDV